MKRITISQLIPTLNKICEEFGLEKKSVVHRFTPAGEHGYLKAYEIYKQRHRYTLVLAIGAKNNAKKFS